MSWHLVMLLIYVITLSVKLVIFISICQYIYHSLSDIFNIIIFDYTRITIYTSKKVNKAFQIGSTFSLAQLSNAMAL